MGHDALGLNHPPLKLGRVDELLEAKMGRDVLPRTNLTKDFDSGRGCPLIDLAHQTIKAKLCSNRKKDHSTFPM